jgi:hypothetical protein
MNNNMNENNWAPIADSDDDLDQANKYFDNAARGDAVAVDVDEESDNASTTNATTKKAKVTPASGNKIGASRGPQYTIIEDYMICMAFITASEDSTAGASQKSATFKKKMYDFYIGNCKEQTKMDRSRISGMMQSTGRASPAAADDDDNDYDARSANAIYDRFKNIISFKCTKLLGVERTTARPSGFDDDKYQKLINHTFQVRFPKFGSADDICVCYKNG